MVFTSVRASSALATGPLAMRELPHALQQLEPDEVEDVLCIYKDVLGTEDSNRGSMCRSPVSTVGSRQPSRATLPAPNGAQADAADASTSGYLKASFQYGRPFMFRCHRSSNTFCDWSIR